MSSPSASARAAVTIAAAPSAPMLTAVTPSSFPVGPFSLTLTGSGFSPDATVYFDNVAVSTTVQSSTSVTATGSAAVAKTVTLYVRTSGGASNTMAVIVTNPQTSVAVVISPATASVRVRRSRQFTAAVTGTTDTAVRWSVNGIVGGNGTVGTISSSGLYKAPRSVPNPATVTIRGTSVADPATSGSASVTITR
jgi:hypothetical protein